MRYSKCVVCSKAVGWVGLVSNMALTIIKLFVGLVSGSQALVADSLYSAKDFITSGLIIVGLKVSRQPIDKEHPYGHGKIEFILSGAVSVMFIVLTGVIFLFAAEYLMHEEHKAPHLIALWTAIFSIVANALLYAYTKCVSVEINSPIVKTLSKHHKADGLSSMAVAVGIIGSHYLGLPWLDALVATFESIHLFYIGAEIFWDSFQGLMDSSAPKEVMDDIKNEAANVTGVKSIEHLRTRRIGQELWVEMTVGVEPDLSIASAKKISDCVEETVVRSISHIGNINVHFRSPVGSVPELATIKAEGFGGDDGTSTDKPVGNK